jgi:FkbM family methyltransferase
MKLGATKYYRFFHVKAPDWLFALYADYLYRLPNKNHITIIPKGKHWVVSRDNVSMISPTAKFLGTSLRAFENKFEQILRIEPGDIVVDVGACIGETTIPPLIKVGPQGSVIAIEPEPCNVKYLKANTSSFNNIQIIPKAAWNKKEKLRFYVSDWSIQGHSIVDKLDSFIEVEADTLDNMLADTKQIDFLKMDVQGAEVKVLSGAERTLEKTKKAVVETHYFGEKGTKHGVATFLRDRGFSARITPDRIVHAWKKCPEPMPFRSRNGT